MNNAPAIREIKIGGFIDSIYGNAPPPSALSSEVRHALDELTAKAVERAHARARVDKAYDFWLDQRQILRDALAQAEHRAADGRKLETAAAEEHRLFAKSLADHEASDDRAIAASIAAGESVELPEGWGHGHLKLDGLRYAAERASAARKLLEQAVIDARIALARVDARITDAAEAITIAEASAKGELLSELRSYGIENAEQLAGVGGDAFLGSVLIPDGVQAVISLILGESTSSGLISARDGRIAQAANYWRARRAALIQGDNV